MPLGRGASGDLHYRGGEGKSSSLVRSLALAGVAPIEGLGMAQGSGGEPVIAMSLLVAM